MTDIRAILFDMDGTLYSFDDKEESSFRTSAFGKTVLANCVRFFEEKCQISQAEAESLFHNLHQKYNGEVSLAVEKEFGISRNEYFSFTWDVPAHTFVAPNQALVQGLSELSVPAAVLTAAPKIWADRAITRLGLHNFFGDAIFTGDHDVRKPQSEAFLQVSRFWDLKPHHILAIGDQEATDILPAKSIGMKTLRIAKRAKTEADFIAPDVLSALQKLKKEGIL